MAPTRIETPAHQPGDRFSIMPIANRKKKMCRELKVVMLGNGGVGKTRVLSALTNNCGTSVGLDFRTKMASVDGEIVKLQLWHAANQEKFGAGLLPRSYYRNARGAFIVFNTADRASFLAAIEWARQLQETHEKHQPLALVLVAVARHQQSKTPTQVSVSEARAMASSLQAKLVEFTGPEDGELCLQAMVDALTVPTPWCVDLSKALSTMENIQNAIKEEASADSETESESEPENVEDEVDQVPIKSLVLAPSVDTVTKFVTLAPGRRASGLFMMLELGHATPSVGVFCSAKRSALMGMCLLLCMSPVLLVMMWLLLAANTNSSTTTGGFLKIVELVQHGVLESTPTLARLGSP